MSAPRHGFHLEARVRARRGDAPPGSSPAERLLYAIGAHPDFAESVLGDLAEERARLEEERGVAAARWWYLGQAIRSVPHLAWNAVRHGGTRGRARVTALAGAVVVVPAAVMLLMPPALDPTVRLVPESQGVRDPLDGFALNTTHAVQLAMRAFDAKGRLLSSPDVRYRVVEGTSASVTERGVARCNENGDALIRASVGRATTVVPLHCELVTKVDAPASLHLVAGDPPQSLSFQGLDGERRPVGRLTGRLSVDDSSVVELRGIEVRPLKPGHATVVIQVGDVQATTDVTVDDRESALGGTTPTQRVVVLPVRLGLEQSVRWPLPRGQFNLLYRRTAKDRPLPLVSVDGPVRCSPAFGPAVDSVSCVVRGPGATLSMAHPGKPFRRIAGALALERTNVK